MSTAPPPPAPPAAWQPPPPTYRRTNGMAVASLVLGMPCFWGFFVPPLLAVIFGHVSLGRIATSGGTQGGRGLAIAGLVLGWIGLALFVLLSFVWLGYGISNI